MLGWQSHHLAFAVGTVAHQAVGRVELLAAGDRRRIIPAAAAGVGICRWGCFPPRVLVGMSFCRMPMIPRRLPVRSFAVVLVLVWSLVGGNLEPHQEQRHHTTTGRIATRQCRSSVKCVAEDGEVWRCPWWAVCTSSILSVCTRHATAARASRHATKAGSALEVLRAYTTDMDTSFPVPQLSSSPDLFCSDAAGKKDRAKCRRLLCMCQVNPEY
jgi:hypothetical protein